MTVSVKAIDALLPQTQCQECGFKGCMPYAEALAQDAAPIDRCPPGGVETMQALAALLNKEAAPYLDAVKANTRAPALAFIREAECIGCTKCLPACPVDAIIGSAKSMHAIITTECTGCGLCIEPCPVDCIELLPVETLNYDKENARLRFQNKQIRELRRQHEQQQSYREKRQLSQNADNASADRDAKQAYILQALSRVKAKKTV